MEATCLSKYCPDTRDPGDAICTTESFDRSCVRAGLVGRDFVYRFYSKAIRRNSYVVNLNFCRWRFDPCQILARANFWYHVLLLSLFSEHYRFQGIGVRSARYESIREYFGESEVDLVDCRHMILEVLYAFEREPLSLVDRVVADNPLLRWHSA